MAASSNDSFGLKIATAFSIALSVVLLVAVYFLNSSYNQEFEKNAAAQKKNTDLNAQLRDVTNQTNDYRGFIGYPNLEEFETVKAAMKKDQDQVRLDIQAMQTDAATIIGDFQKKMEGKGVDASQFEALKARAREVVDSITNNSDPSYKASINRLKDLTVNQSKLTTTLAASYIELRRDLELANKVNADQKKVIETAFAKAKTDLEETIRRDEEERSSLVKTTREQAELLATAETTLTNTRNDLVGKIEKREKTIADISASNRDLRDRASRKEDVMSKPGGRVTFVDYSSNTVRVNVNRSQGVRPLMKFTIFDKNAAGVTSARPKAAVELINVGDPQKGENDSLARIVKTFDPNDPIKYNDFIFSVGWSYDHPQRFALVGKLDMNRDGRDDRADLIRMIEASGGVVEFDLPPPNVDRGPGQAAVARAFTRLGQPQPPSVGRASGKISALAYAYVVDDRLPLTQYARKAPEQTKEDTAFHEEESTATKEARDNSVRPLPLEKLLNMLGYDYSAPIEGRREAFDKNAVKQLLKPKGGSSVPAPQPSNSDTPKDDAAPPK